MKEALSQNEIKFLYVDIFSSMGAFKKFLKIRDTSEEHKMAREKHNIGIPCIVCDDSIFIVEGKEHIQQLLENGTFVEKDL